MQPDFLVEGDEWPNLKTKDKLYVCVHMLCVSVLKQGNLDHTPFVSNLKAIFDF